MIYTFWKVFRFNRREEKTHVARYRQDLKFRQLDSALKKTYFWQNPYRISRKYWNEASYGETPLSVIEEIGGRVGLGCTDTFVDLGAGRGRSVFFAHHRFGCKAVGIEKVPLFVSKAVALKRKFQVDGVDFHEGDLRNLPRLEGTVFYAAWTCFSSDLVQSVTSLFKRLPKKAKVVTVSEKISSHRCKLVDRFTALFAWGEGEIYIHEII